MSGFFICDVEGNCTLTVANCRRAKCIVIIWFFMQNILAECGKRQCSAAWRQQCRDGRWAKWSSPPPSECRRTETDPGAECC